MNLVNIFTNCIQQGRHTVIVINCLTLHLGDRTYVL